MTSFEILARHFAEQENTRVIFKDKVCPQTDGKTILLPKVISDHCILPTIGALLHESAHIKYTDFYSLNQDSTAKKLILNLLEDIRIDHKVFKKYGGGKKLYRKLMETANMKADEFDVSDLTQRFIDMVRHIYAYGIGMPEFFYRKEFTEKFMNDPIRKKALDEIIKNSIDSKDTTGLNYSVNRLATMLKDYIEEEEKKEQNGEEGDEGEGEGEGEEGDNEGEGENEESESKGNSKKAKNKTSRQQAKKQKRKELKDTEKELEENQKEKAEIKKEADKIIEKSNQNYDKRHNCKDDEEYKKWREEQLRLKKEYQKQRRKLNKAYKEERELENKKQNIENSLNDLDNNKDEDAYEIIDAELDEEHGVNRVLIGFKNLTESVAFKVSKEEIVDFESSMKRIFQRLEHKKFYTNNTGKVNLKSIHKIFIGGEQDYSDIFVTDKITEEYHNKVIFLLDGSGSMGSINSHKNQALCNCVYNLARIIEANKDNYNIEYEINVFSDYVKTIKPFDNGKQILETADKFIETITNNRSGGGTEIIGALKYCYNKFEQTATPKDRKFIICFTDAEFRYTDMDIILKEYNARPERIIFIGIQQKDDTYSIDKRFYEQILMKRLVSTTSEMEKTLIESFDRIL